MRRSFVGLVLVLAMLGAGCSADTPAVQSSTPSPMRTVAAWFDAIDSQNVGAARALFVPASQSQTGWVANAPKNAFTDVRCHPEPPSTSTRAAIYCTFKEAPGSWSGNPDTFWNVYVTKSRSRWLITGYGQG